MVIEYEPPDSEIIPDRVNTSAAFVTDRVLFAVRVIFPDELLVASFNVPPAMVIGFGPIATLCKSSVPALEIVMAPDVAPRPELLLTFNVPALMVTPPLKVFVPEKLTVPLLVESPITNAPVPAPETTPLKVVVTPDAAAILFVPVARVIALVIVLFALTSKIPPPIVTVPVDRFDPLTPPEATDIVPALIVVPPV